ncbi:MAG: methylamine utilization protein MauJ [Thermodesulfobacteriota bacterium]
MWVFTFKINKKSPIEADSEKDGVKVSIKLGAENLVIENVDVNNQEDALKKADEVANNFLNTLSWKFGVDIGIKTDSIRSEFIYESGKTTVYIQLLEGVSIDDGSLTIKKIDADGNVTETYDSRRPGKINVNSSEAAFYHRRGRLSSDPFDRFRNFYLVVENIGDRIRISKAICHLDERPLLELALKECFGSDIRPLDSVARKVRGFDLNVDVISDVAKFLYKGHRCQINHSKALEDKKIPFNAEAEKEVKEALPLIEFVAKSLLEYEERNL